MKFKVGDVVKRKNSEKLKFKISCIDCDEVGNEIIKIVSTPNKGISEICYPEQLEKVM